MIIYLRYQYWRTSYTNIFFVVQELRIVRSSSALSFATTVEAGAGHLRPRSAASDMLWRFWWFSFGTSGWFGIVWSQFGVIFVGKIMISLGFCPKLWWFYCFLREENDDEPVKWAFFVLGGKISGSVRLTFFNWKPLPSEFDGGYWFLEDGDELVTMIGLGYPILW